MQKECVIVAQRGRGENNTQCFELRFDGISNTITTVQKDNYILIGNLFDYETEQKDE